MKHEIERYLAGAPEGFGYAVVREYLQARVLQHLSLSGHMTSLAFMGGTALRFLYAAPRYSEDLDFALESNREGYDFGDVLDSVVRGFEREAYSVEVKYRGSRTAVDKTFVKFPGLLHEVGVSRLADQVLSVKLEVDTNPPAGASLEVTTIRRFVVVRVQHHDRASLFAGKLAAVLMRQYTKGRDLYDLMWYLSDPVWPAPNLTLLRNAAKQGAWGGAELTDERWPSAVLERLETVDWPKARTEAEQFLERPQEADLLELDTFAHLLRQREAR